VAGAGVELDRVRNHGRDNDGVFEESSTAPTATHLWSSPGVYPVILRVRNERNDTMTAIKSIRVTNHGPGTPEITGLAEGKMKVETTYNVTSSDPDNDTLSYFIDWGDGTNSSWIGPYPSGGVVTVSHTWSKRGSYIVKAKTRDGFNESDWGTLVVTMPLSYEPRGMFFTWLFGRFPHAFPFLRHRFGY